MLLRAIDIMAFHKMLSEFAEGLFDEEKRVPRAFYETDHSGPLTLFEVCSTGPSRHCRAGDFTEGTRGHWQTSRAYLEPIDDLIAVRLA